MIACSDKTYLSILYFLWSGKSPLAHVRCDRTYDTYVIFPITYSCTYGTRTLFCRTLTSLYDENKLCVSYLQPKLTTVSTECVIDSRKRKQ